MAARLSALPITHGPRTQTNPSCPATVSEGIRPRRILRCGEHLFHAGEPCNSAYLVCSGSLESYFVHADGEEQILGLHGAGEVVGFDALFGQLASASVKALDTVSLQVLQNPGRLLGLDDCSPEVRVLIGAMHQEIRRCRRRLHIERHPSERRLAEFLLDLAEGADKRGMSRTRLILPVNRRELARYLGLAPETLSRTFASLQERAVLAVDNREVSILDSTALHAIAEP